MPTQPVLLTPNTENLLPLLTSLPRLTGICIFLDISRSTDLQTSDEYLWIPPFLNFFSSLNQLLAPLKPVKTIGDGAMYFIEESDLLSSGHTLLSLFDVLYKVILDPENPYPQLRVGLTYCTDIFPITFLPLSSSQTDYYGTDINLAARLQSSAEPGTIRMNEAFFKRLEQTALAQSDSHFDYVMEFGLVIDEDISGFEGIRFYET